MAEPTYPGKAPAASSPSKLSLALPLSERGVPSLVPHERVANGLTMPNEAQDTKAMLAQQLAEGTSAAQIADMAVATWAAIDEALSPIIGQRGFAALYKRSLQLTGAEFEWLATTQDGVVQTADFSTFHTVLTQQSAATAMAASTALLVTFYDLLTRLIGPSLTDRLLRPVWDKPTSGHPAQDKSP